MTWQAGEQVSLCDLGIWSGKMSPEPSAPTEEKTSQPSSKKPSASQSRKPPILKCLKKAGQLGGATTMKWEDDGAWLGECMMRNTGESPNAAVVSRLSQILEGTPQEKYSLSAKACQGILRRAERRGKDLPETLKAVLLMQSESGGAVTEEEKAPTLNAECGGNKPAVLCLNDQGGNVMGASHDVSSTLRAQEHGHQPSILDMSHACDVIRDCGEVAPSLQARMGTGGNQVPLVTDCGFFNCYENISQTLLARTYKDPHIVASHEKTGSICTKSYPSKLADQDIVNGCYPAVKGGNGMVVRRLTPMECERLQGFPDGWTDIGEWRDSKGKLRKPSDSPRYKALGNSIALPFWDFLAKRISAQYLRPVTMGSLFDGIGGFPLVFERHNGKGTARWASEIEEFPIAVTKLRFGEE